MAQERRFIEWHAVCGSWSGLLGMVPSECRHSRRKSQVPASFHQGLQLTLHELAHAVVNHIVLRQIAPRIRSSLSNAAQIGADDTAERPSPRWDQGSRSCAAHVHRVSGRGYANEDAPLDSEREETIKRIGAALSSGRRFMHFANCKGHIDNAGFEQASTAKVFNCRKLGSNESSADLKLPNETEFNISANTGFSFSEDFNLRCRKISLVYSEEDANSRRFRDTDLHGWILEHRQELLNAVAGLIQCWHQQACPPGETAFTSFPEWARVVGGILVTCGLGDPCVPQLDGTLTSDTTTAEMKKLFQIGFQEKPNEWSPGYRWDGGGIYNAALWPSPAASSSATRQAMATILGPDLRAGVEGASTIPARWHSPPAPSTATRQAMAAPATVRHNPARPAGRGLRVRRG